MKAYIHRTSGNYENEPGCPFEGCIKEGTDDDYIYTYEASAEELLRLPEKIGEDIIVSRVDDDDEFLIGLGCDVDIEIYDTYRE